VSPEGEVKALYDEIDGINLENTGQWTSPVTGATNLSGRVVNIESLNMNLTFDPIVSSYWEGKVRVTGNQSTRPIKGDGYVELSGFTDPDPIEWLDQ
jgi:predicted secreted hydrolase